MRLRAMNHLRTLIVCSRASVCICSVRTITKVRSAVSIPQSLTEALETSELKHKHHPGARKRVQVKLPEKLLVAAGRVLETQDMTRLREAALLLRNQHWSRHLPTEDDEVRARAMSIEKELLGNALEMMSQEERESVEEDVKRAVFEKLKHRVRLWKPVNYDEFGARTYLVARLAADYAVVHDVFHEIRHLDPAFSPASIMDFGSGIGTCYWAAKNIWPKYFQEYYSIDISNHMHNLARLLVNGGNTKSELKLPSFFQREFLPATDAITFDLVVSAFTMMELPNAQRRLETVASLWGKTSRFLVLIENGTQAGHNAIAEARDFILMISKDSGQKPARVLAPKMQGAAARYSYVVLQKHGDIPEEREWGRLIRPVLRRSRHVVCRMCCSDGCLKEFVFTKSKHGRHVYRVARCSKWGDQLPFSIMPPGEKGMPLSESAEDIDDEFKHVDSE